MTDQGHTSASRSTNQRRAVIGITLGDPLGIGPEIVAKALVDPRVKHLAELRVYGDDRPFLVGDGVRRTSTAGGGAASFEWVEQAIADAKRDEDDPKRVDAIVTAPISKTSWNLAGHTEFPGHTELLATRFGASKSGMLFVGPHLRVMLATIHVPLMTVGKVLTVAKVREAIELADQSCVEMGAVGPEGRPRIAVAGLNPHAGEGGILGEEDDRIIRPAVEQARTQGILATGPLPGDTVFNAAAAAPVGKGLYECVVAMYHDQGLIPVKLVDREQAVNVTVGLPTIRTSPAHGTAFDIAGKGIASSESMVAAISLAVKMVKIRRAQ